jgi:hypothetical protein
MQASTVAEELIGDAEAQVVALVVGGNGGITPTEQLGEVRRSDSWPVRRTLISTGGWHGGSSGPVGRSAACHGVPPAGRGLRRFVDDVRDWR